MAILFLLSGCGGDGQGGEDPPDGHAPSETLSSVSPSPDPTPAASPDRLDACSILTEEDVSAVIGIEAARSNDVVSEDPSSCNYSSSGNPAFVDFSVFTGQVTDAQSYYDTVTELWRRIAPDGVETVTGVGERAEWAAGSLNMLTALQAGSVVEVSVNALFDAELPMDEKQAAIELAKKALSRLLNQ